MLPKPDWSYEAPFQTSGDNRICGVDEAGRGPLAGPVIAAAVILNPHALPAGLADSKKLSQNQRKKALNEIMEKAFVGIGIAEPEEIDRLNILWASMIAMQRAVAALPVMPMTALIDGNRSPDLPCQSQAIVKGDAKSLSIAAASIVAKVTRDRIMIEADKRFPGYGLASHKGYLTPAHKQALIDLGPCPIHRFSFAPVKAVI